MVFFFTLLINGLLVGVMYSLVALGFVVIYKATRTFNFAQGEFVMLGGVFTATALEYYGVPLLYSVLIGLAATALLGIIVEKIILRPLIKGRAEVIAIVMATLGLSFVLKGIFMLVWKAAVMNITLPIRMKPIIFLDMLVKPITIVGAVISLTFLAIFSYIFMRIRFGIALRAVADDNVTAQLMGINLKLFVAFAWGLTGLVAAIGGIVWGSMMGVDVYLSIMGLKVFPVVVLGGMTSIPGAVLAGLIVGATESIAAGYIDPFVGGGLKNFVPYVITIIVLMIRPYGFFGEEDIDSL